MRRKTCIKRIPAGTVGGAVIVGAYVFAVRPWFLRWGATAAEVNETLPGDELMSHPKHHNTHAVTIHAPIPEVWSWLVQVGQSAGRLL